MKPVTSAIGESQSGFTLLELLVVITILVLLTLAIPVALPRLISPQTVVADAESLASVLREIRERSVTEGRALELLPRPADAALNTADRSPLWSASTGIAMQWHTDTPAAALRFFPDGSSSGGTFDLRLDKQSATVWVSPLTGRITVRRP